MHVIDKSIQEQLRWNAITHPIEIFRQWIMHVLG